MIIVKPLSLPSTLQSEEGSESETPLSFFTAEKRALSMVKEQFG